MTLDTKASVDATVSQGNDIELGMRRALGLGGAKVGHTRRFAKDGEVPVVVLRANRDAGREAIEAALSDERIARERAERALAAAQETIRNLQTKVAHNDLALDDAREALRRITSEKQFLETELLAQSAVREAAEARFEGEVVDPESG